MIDNAESNTYDMDTFDWGRVESDWSTNSSRLPDSELSMGTTGSVANGLAKSDSVYLKRWERKQSFIHIRE
jgi:hypothetical protein